MPFRQEVPAEPTVVRAQRKVLLEMKEDKDQSQIWRYNDAGSPGALRLISVSALLRGGKILLYEWPVDMILPRDGNRLYSKISQAPIPRYAALSHVWEASPAATRAADKANKPLRIDCGGPKQYVHTISWLGLFQAALAAAHFGCKYLWLDLLCLNQVSHEDKVLQIRNMARIYANADEVIIMPGGVAAAQGLDETSTWMQRAWTFQEATLCFHPAVLVAWPLKGSFWSLTGISVDRIPAGDIGVVRLSELLELTPGQLFESGSLKVEGEKDIEWELGFPFRCLGDDKAALDALNAGMRTGHGWTRSNSEASTDDDVGTDYGDNDFDTEYGDDDENGDDWEDVDEWEDADEDENSSGVSSGHERGSSDEEDQGLDSDREDEGLSSEPAASDDNSSVRSTSDNGDAPEPLHIAAWRSMWLRTSTKPQDLVYSMMHYLGVSIAVSYQRPLEELIFDLISKTAIPAWLAIGYDIPVNPRSGLLPILPVFTPNAPPTYTVDGVTEFASKLVFADYYCPKFDIVIKETSSDKGHLVCARLLEVQKSSPPTQDRANPSFYDSEVSLRCPTLEFNADCHFKGRMGHLLVIIGTLSKDPEGLGDEDGKGMPFVHLLEKSEAHGTWQKTGAGALDEPIFKRKEYRHGIVRRHLRVGGTELAEEPTECDCDTGESPRQLKDDIEPLQTQVDLDEALIKASSDANEHQIRALVAAGANINAEGNSHKENGSPLQAACRTGKPRIVRLLIDDYSADVNGSNPWQFGTALQTACTFGFERVARVLLERGADVNAPGGPEGGPALHLATGNKLLLQLLLDHGADLHVNSEVHGTALMAAAGRDEEGSEDIIQMLLDYGADINSTEGTYSDYNSGGRTFRTPLQMACKSGTLRLVRFLIEKGADVNLYAEGGSFCTALQVAAKGGWALMCKELLRHGADVHKSGGYYGHALQAAAASSRNNHSEEVARLLIEHGANINAHGGHYGNALQAAVSANMPDINMVRYLVEQGADVNAVGGYWGTPLQGSMSSDNPNKEVIQLLLDHGADVNIVGVGYHGCALSAAVTRETYWAKTVNDLLSFLLLERGADVNAAGGYYGFPLQAAARSWLENLGAELVQYFILHGADVNAHGGYYGTALQAAAASGRADVGVVKVLLENGADVNARGGEFGSALQAAAHENNPKVIRLLVEAGAHVDHVNNKYKETIKKAMEG